MQKTWTNDDILILTTLFPHSETEQVAIKLDRTVESVRSKAHELGVVKTREHRMKVIRDAQLACRASGNFKPFTKGNEVWKKRWQKDIDEPLMPRILKPSIGVTVHRIR